MSVWNLLLVEITDSIEQRRDPWALLLFLRILIGSGQHWDGWLDGWMTWACHGPQPKRRWSSSSSYVECCSCRPRKTTSVLFASIHPSIHPALVGLSTIWPESLGYYPSLLANVRENETSMTSVSSPSHSLTHSFIRWFDSGWFPRAKDGTTLFETSLLVASSLDKPSEGTCVKCEDTRGLVDGSLGLYYACTIAHW